MASQAPANKRARTSLACESCRSRKLSCDGARPCTRCRQECRPCIEPEPPDRTPLTRKRMSELEARIAAYEQTWTALHSTVSLDDAHAMLLAIGADATAQELSRRGSACCLRTDAAFQGLGNELATYPPTRPASPRAVALGLSHDMPTASHGQMDKWAEDASLSDPSPRDVHGAIPTNDYGTGVRGGVGYMGLASAATLLRAIQKFAPASCERLSHHSASAASLSSSSFATARPASDAGISDGKPHKPVHRPIRLPPASEYSPLVDTYFQYFHALHPLVHEPTIRAQLTGALPLPGNASNHVLIYMIFATGAFDSATDDSVVSNGAEYYELARHFLQQDLFAAGSLVLVQGMAIMAIYLQRCNRPNAGYVCLGLAVRMAMALGLHVSVANETIDGMSVLESEMRNRVWWSLVAIEAGMSMTYGRPHGIALSSLMTARLPANVDDENLTVSTSVQPPDAAHPTRYTALIVQARLAQLAFRSLDRIGRSLPAPTVEQVKWCGDYFRIQAAAIPQYMHGPVPPAHKLASAIQRWRARYYRGVIYRPVFLSAAWSHGATATSDTAVREIIENCRSLAVENLHDIGEHTRTHPDPHRGTEWYTLYFAIQASLTLLLSIVREPRDPRAPEWRQSIAETIEWLYQLKSMRQLGTSYAQIMEAILGSNSSGLEPNDGQTRAFQTAMTDFAPPMIDSFNFDRYFAEIWDGGTQMSGIPGDFFHNDGMEAHRGWVDTFPHDIAR